MNFNPSQAPTAYAQSDQNRFRDMLRQIFGFVLFSNRDVELQPNVRLIMTSPNGTRYAFTVDNAGALTSVAL